MTRTPVHAEPGQRRGSPPGGPTDSGPFAPSKSPSTIRLGLSPNRRLPTDSAEEAQNLSPTPGAQPSVLFYPVMSGFRKGGASIDPGVPFAYSVRASRLTFRPA